MDLCVREDLTDYDAALAQFQTQMGNSGLGRSTAEFQAAGIYEAATDGKQQMRYLIGEDAVQTYAMREQVGDDAFIAGMKQRFFGKSLT